MQDAQQAAQELLDKNRITEPLVNAFEIASNEGITIQLFDPERSEKLRNVAGFFDPKKNTIFINNQDPTNRQQFTVAHELGHYKLGHQNAGVLLRQQIYESQKPAIEKEADEFAGNLLVPLPMLKGVMKEYDLDERSVDVELLARIFGVSKEVIKIRLERLKKTQFVST